MRKAGMAFILVFTLIISACSSGTKEASTTQESKSGKITYQSENGPVEVPANPQRVVVLSTFAGNVMALNVNLAGVDSWTKMNPRMEEKLKNVVAASDENLEKIIELNPDLIIGLSNTKNIEKLRQIAPTVTFTYGKLDYLTQHLEIGKVLNKEKEAQAWIDDFKKRARKAGDDIRAKIGENTTVSVIETFEKQLYVFGNNWARGTEILYQEMKLKMPKKVEEMALKDGFYALSAEVLPEFAGDYLIISKNPDADNSFQSSELYKNIPAVKNNRVFEANSKEFYFNDPLTLEYQLEFFKTKFLGK
jgi:iron complex transport system substrate-binding protein